MKTTYVSKGVDLAPTVLLILAVTIVVVFVILAIIGGSTGPLAVIGKAISELLTFRLP